MTQTHEPLETLLEVRRARCDEAERALAEAIAREGRVRTRQGELDAGAQAARERWLAARAATIASLPTDAAAALAERRYLERLRAEADGAAAAAKGHRDGELAAAEAASRQARTMLTERHRDRDAIETLLAKRAEAERRERDRRSEDEASDLALALRHARERR